MMKKILYIIAILICAVSVQAADVYIDPNWTGTESGTVAEPYDSWADISFSASDDYYQKCGTTDTRSTSLIVAVTGKQPRPEQLLSQ